MDIIVDVAFIIAVTAFLKEQFGITGRAVLLTAFVIAFFFGSLPLLEAVLPNIAPWLDVFAKTFVLFLAAAGSYDAVRDLTKRK